jgi:hypothetical protein
LPLGRRATYGRRYTGKEVVRSMYSSGTREVTAR